MYYIDIGIYFHYCGKGGWLPTKSKSSTSSGPLSLIILEDMTTLGDMLEIYYLCTRYLYRVDDWLRNVLTIFIGWMIDYGIEIKYILCYSNMCLAISTGLATEIRCVCVCSCMSLCVSWCVSLYMSGYVSLYVSWCVSLCVSLCSPYMCSYMCRYACLDVSLYVSICVLIRVPCVCSLRVLIYVSSCARPFFVCDFVWMFLL